MTAATRLNPVSRPIATQTPSPRTTKLYDRTKDEITLSEVERIRL
jgi:hypothetical protein